MALIVCPVHKYIHEHTARCYRCQKEEKIEKRKIDPISRTDAAFAIEIWSRAIIAKMFSYNRGGSEKSLEQFAAENSNINHSPRLIALINKVKPCFNWDGINRLIEDVNKDKE